MKSLTQFINESKESAILRVCKEIANDKVEVCDTKIAQKLLDGVTADFISHKAKEIDFGGKVIPDGDDIAEIDCIWCFYNEKFAAVIQYNKRFVFYIIEAGEKNGKISRSIVDSTTYNKEIYKEIQQALQKYGPMKFLKGTRQYFKNIDIINI